MEGRHFQQGLYGSLWVLLLGSFPKTFPCIAHKGGTDGQEMETFVLLDHFHAKRQVVGFHAIDRFAAFARSFFPLSDSSFLRTSWILEGRRKITASRIILERHKKETSLRKESNWPVCLCQACVYQHNLSRLLKALLDLMAPCLAVLCFLELQS